MKTPDLRRVPLRLMTKRGDRAAEEFGSVYHRDVNRVDVADPCTSELDESRDDLVRRAFEAGRHYERMARQQKRQRRPAATK